MLHVRIKDLGSECVEGLNRWCKTCDHQWKAVFRTFPCGSQVRWRKGGIIFYINVHKKNTKMKHLSPLTVHTKTSAMNVFPKLLFFHQKTSSADNTIFPTLFLQPLYTLSKHVLLALLVCFQVQQIECLLYVKIHHTKHIRTSLSTAESAFAKNTFW